MKKISFVSLGCSKNLVDSEIMSAKLNRDGFLITTSTDEADLIVINTCGFIEAAKEESIQEILAFGEWKKEKEGRKLIVSGCLAQRYSEELEQELPEVDGFLGTGTFTNISEAARHVLGSERVLNVGLPGLDYEPAYERTLSTAKHFAYLKIAEGCNHTCAFCIIPKLRGPYQSRSFESVSKEARELALKDVKELVIIAQDTTYYGREKGGRSKLVPLLQELDSLPFTWIRLLYTYPSEISDDLVFALKELNSLVKYIDMPLQHGSNRILERMRRPERREKVIELVKKLRDEVPNVFLRSSFIVGFPGETEEDFDSLLDLLETLELDHASFFIYSQEEGTLAGDYLDQIPEETKRERLRQAIEVQEAITEKRNIEKIGQTLMVLIDEKLEDNLYKGRHQGQAPEDIDGAVFINSDKELHTGDFVTIEIETVEVFDLWGSVR